MKKRSLTLLIMVFILITIPIRVNAIFTNNEEQENLIPDGFLETKISQEENIIHRSISKEKQNEKAVTTMNITPYTTINYFSYQGISGGFEAMVYEDNNYDYYLAQTTGTITQKFEIYKHDILNNTNETFYNSGNTCKGLSYFSKGNILYFEYISDYVYGKKDAYNKVSILKYETTTGKTTVMGPFDVTVYDSDYYPSFAVDSKERFYFVSDYDDFIVYDNKAKLVSKMAPKNSAEAEIIINGISPNDEALLYSVNGNRSSLYRDFIYKGIQHLNDGKFTYPDAYTIMSRNPLDNSSFKEDPKWNFLDAQGSYAINQYGQIVKFNYDDDSEMGVSYSTILDLERTIEDSSYSIPDNVPITKIGNYYYVAGQGNIIFLIDSNFTKVKKIDLGFNSNEYYYTIKRLSNKNGSLYVRYNNKIYVVNNPEKNAEEFKTITYSNHSTQNHTQKEIKQKYTKPLTHNYNTSMFTTEPLATNPYRAGVFKQAVVDDTLEKINFYRWLYGIDPITVRTEKMERNQKGAVLLAKLNKLTHYPDKPSDMSSSFYEEAYAGCNVGSSNGDVYSGNCSMGEKYMYEAISGYIDEIYNISGMVGHRLSLLDPYATQTSFGFCNNYSTLSMYYDNDHSDREEPFYAYPSVGNFPSEEMYTNEYWHLYIGYNVFGKFKVQFVYNGKEYSAQSVSAESGYPVIDFKLPNELIQELGGTGKRIPAGTELEVKVIGLQNTKADSVNYDYKVKFFSMDSILNDFTLNKTNTTIIEGKEQKLTLTLNPTNAIPEGVAQWKSQNTQIATVDNNGVVTAIKPGETKITVTLDGITKECNVKVIEKPPFQLGDVNEDGDITAEDAKNVLDYIAGKVDFTTEQTEAANVNGDDDITAEDAKRILDYIAGKIEDF